MIQLDQSSALHVTDPGVNPVVTPSITGTGPNEFWLAVASEASDPLNSGYTTIGLDGTINSPWAPTPQYQPPNQPSYPPWTGAATISETGISTRFANFGVTGNTIAKYSAAIANFISTIGPISIVNQTNYSNPTNVGSGTVAIPATTAGNLVVIAVSGAGGAGIVSVKLGSVDCTEVIGDSIGATEATIWMCPASGGETGVTFLASNSPLIWVFELAESGTPACELAVSPTGLSFTATEGGANPATQDVTVTNIGGGGSVPFNFFASQSWMTPNSGSGTTPGTVTVGIDITGLTAGVYTGTLLLTSSCGSPPVTILVSITIIGPTIRCDVLDGDGNSISTFISDLCLVIAPATALYTNIIPKTQINAYETTNEGRNAVVMDFNSGTGLYSRDLGTIFAWEMSCRTVLYQWQPSIIPMPEGIYGRASDWDDGGTSGNKFIQGVMVAADSFGNPKTFFLEDSDTNTAHVLNECPAVFNLNTEQEIAFSCVPFTAHSARLISTDGVEWRVWSSKIVFQPWPEQTLLWQTEMTALGLTGWGHAREMNIPHVSFADLTLVLTFDSWPTITLTIPSSGGIQNKTKVTLPPNKFKLMGLKISSTAKFNLFASDMELKVGEWGRQGSYQVLKPFGGQSRVGAIV